MYKHQDRREFIRLSAAGLVLPSFTGLAWKRFIEDGRIELTEEALEIHRSAILIDGHNDLPERIRESGHLSLDGFSLENSHSSNV